MALFNTLHTNRLIIDGNEVELVSHVMMMEMVQNATFTGFEALERPFELDMMYRPLGSSSPNDRTHLKAKLPFSAVEFINLPTEASSKKIDVVYEIPELKLKCLATVKSAFLKDYYSAKQKHDSHAAFNGLANDKGEISENRIESEISQGEVDEGKFGWIAIAVGFICVMAVISNL